jgi:hypothetical protein
MNYERLRAFETSEYVCKLLNQFDPVHYEPLKIRHVWNLRRIWSINRGSSNQNSCQSFAIIDSRLCGPNQFVQWYQRFAVESGIFFDADQPDRAVRISGGMRGRGFPEDLLRHVSIRSIAHDQNVSWKL